MTPTELREARRKLGLSASGLATALQLGTHGGRTVRRWEAGDSAIPGPAVVALAYMLADVRKLIAKGPRKLKAVGSDDGG